MKDDTALPAGSIRAFFLFVIALSSIAVIRKSHKDGDHFTNKPAATPERQYSMRLNVKKALLSAFVLPGLGQLMNGRKVKGGIIIFLVNIFILIALAFVAQGMAKLYLAPRQPGVSEVMRTLGEIRTGTPGAKWALSFFFCLWCYSVADALFDSGKDGTTSHETED